MKESKQGKNWSKFHFLKEMHSLGKKMTYEEIMFLRSFPKSHSRRKPFIPNLAVRSNIK